MKLDISKPFTKFLIDSLSRYYFNGFQTNLQLSELLIMLLTQSVTSVDGYLSHVKSIHGKEDDVSRIVELLYDIVSFLFLEIIFFAVSYNDLDFLTSLVLNNY